MAAVPAHPGRDDLARGYFHVDCAGTLCRLYVFFALEAGSRHVDVLGVTASRRGMTVQQARNLLIDLGERAGQFRS